jgi:hypothetical protein
MTSQEANHRSPQSHGRNRDDRFTIKNDETAVNHQKPASSDRRRQSHEAIPRSTDGLQDALGG